MRKVIVAVGLPGSGKTTLLKDFANKYNYTYFSLDDIREEFGFSSENTTTSEIWNALRSRVKECIAMDKVPVIDTVLTKHSARRELLQFLRESGATKIQGVFVDTPAELARERNRGRKRNIPDEKFERRATQLLETPPTFADGFDSLFTLNEHRELVEIETLKGKKEFPFR